MSLKALRIPRDILSALTYSTRQLLSLRLHPPHVPGFGASPLLTDHVCSGVSQPQPPQGCGIRQWDFSPCAWALGDGEGCSLQRLCILHLLTGPAGHGADPGPRQTFPPVPATTAPSHLPSYLCKSLHSSNSSRTPAPKSVTRCAKPSIYVSGFWVCLVSSSRLGAP